MMDKVAAAHLVGGILAALLHREKTGKGQEVQCSLYNTGVWTIAEDIQGASLGNPLPQHDRTRTANPLWNIYRTEDDRWVQLAMIQSDLQWPGFCRALEKPELENDPRSNNTTTREKNCRELIRILDGVFATKNVQEWERRLREFDCIYSLVVTSAEVAVDPQALANGFFSEIGHPVAGAMQIINTPVKFTEDPSSIRAPGPELGQHTEEVLLDLGYGWVDIARMKDEGAIL